ncbi:MAG: ATP-binding protein [Faecousia sp.]
MLYTEQAVRENLRNRDGKRVFYLGTGDRMTASARDYLTRERIEILPASQAAPERYKLLSGGFMEGKPEHMTHLNAQVLVPKNHPRIVFRGKLDSLEAELLLCGQDFPHLEKDLGEVLELARRIIRCDVLEEPLPDGKLCGLTEEELRKRSHFPQDFYGQPHFMPDVRDSREVLRLNRVRCAVREAELSAAAAFVTPEGSAQRPDILRAMNRMSSMVYILMIREKAGRKQEEER